MRHPVLLHGPWGEWHYCQHLLREVLATGRRHGRWLPKDVRHALHAFDVVLTGVLLAAPWLADDCFDDDRA